MIFARRKQAACKVNRMDMDLRKYHHRRFPTRHKCLIKCDSHLEAPLHPFNLFHQPRLPPFSSIWVAVLEQASIEFGFVRFPLEIVHLAFLAMLPVPQP